MLILNLLSFFKFSFFFLLSLLYNTYGHFSVKVFSATTWVRILKFGTKPDSDELYFVTKGQPHFAYQSLYLFIFLSLQWKFLSQISQLLSFSPMEISVTDFSAPIRASGLKFCVHLQEGIVNCVNGN